MHRNVPLAKEEKIRQEAPVGVFVYVLRIEDSSHEKDFIPDSEVVGVYNSKVAALQFASTYVTPENLLSFDEMIEEYGEDGMVVDVRKKGSIIPDDGVIMQYGDDYIGASDIVRMKVKIKMTTMMMVHTKKKAKRTLHD